jgi:hypothetical protein
MSDRAFWISALAHHRADLDEVADSIMEDPFDADTFVGHAATLRGIETELAALTQFLMNLVEDAP